MDSAAARQETLVRRQLAPLACQCAALAVIAFNLNYFIVSLLAGGETTYSAVALSPELPASFILVAMGLLYATVGRIERAYLQDVAASTLLLFTLTAALVSVFAHASARAALTMVFFFLMFMAGYGVARSLASRLARVLAGVLPLLPLVTALVMLLLLAMGRLEFETFWLKPQIVGGIRSSEIAIFVGLQALYCMFAMDVNRRSGSAKLGLFVSLVLLSWLLSFGSIGALLAVLLLRRHLRGARVRLLMPLAFVLAVVVLALVVLPAVQDILLLQLDQKLADYSEEGVRLPTLLLLLERMSSSPLTGIGLGEFVRTSVVPGVPDGLYPHNNLLGIAAELGLPAAVLFMAFSVATFVVGVRAIQRANRGAAGATPSSAMALLSLLAFTYLQIKGLVQDTWQLKELYFWSGVMAGLYGSSADQDNPLRSADSVRSDFAS